MDDRFRFRSGRLFLRRPLQFMLLSANRVPLGVLSSTHPKDLRKSGYSELLFGIYTQTTVRTHFLIMPQTTQIHNTIKEWNWHICMDTMPSCGHFNCVCFVIYDCNEHTSLLLSGELCMNKCFYTGVMLDLVIRKKELWEKTCLESMFPFFPPQHTQFRVTLLLDCN